MKASLIIIINCVTGYQTIGIKLVERESQSYTINVMILVIYDRLEYNISIFRTRSTIGYVSEEYLIIRMKLLIQSLIIMYHTYMDNYNPLP